MPANVVPANPSGAKIAIVMGSKSDWANSDVVLEECLFSDETVAPTAANIPTPLGKFVMYPGWQPDTDFLRMAAMWGLYPYRSCHAH